MVPKPGLSQRGLLKSMMDWAIPASFLHEDVYGAGKNKGTPIVFIGALRPFRIT